MACSLGYPDNKDKIAVVYANEKLEFTDRDLYSGTSYGYFITAYYGSSIVGEARKEFRTKAEDLSISVFKQTGCTETSIDLKWKINPNSGGYVVTVSNAGVKQYVEITRADINTCTITGLSADKRYMVEIACLCDAGKRTRAVVTGKTAAGHVSNLRVTKITATYVGISFNKQNNANSYEVDILINGVWKSYDWRRINCLAGLESKTTYDLRIRSISGDFKSEYEYLTFTTL